MIKNKIQLQDEKQAISIITSRLEASRKTSTRDVARFSIWYRLFRGRQTTKNYQGLANLFVPEPYRIVRKKTAKLANALQKIKALPENEKDIPSSKAGTHLLNFLRRKMNWYITERTAIQESRIIGLAWLKAVWNVNNEDKNKPWKGFDISFETADTIFIDPSSELLDVFNGTNRWLIHEYETDIQDLYGNSNYDQAILDKLITSGSGKKLTSALQYARLVNETRARVTDQQTKKIKIVEYWGKFKESNKDEDDYLIIIANGAYVIRFEINPYKDILDYPIPFVPIPANLVGKEIFPVGDIEPSESLFNELNDTRNQRMDTVTMNIDPAKIVLRGAQINRQDLIVKRGWVIESSIPNGIEFLHPDMQGVTAAINEEKAIRGDIQQVTNVLDFAPGSEVQGGLSIDTATGTAIAKGESDVVTEDEIKTLKLSFTMLYRIILAYAQEFLDKSFTIRVTENGIEEFYNISSKDIQGNLDLDIEMATMQDKTIEQNMALALFNQAKTVPGAKLGKFFTDVLEVFKDNINIQEYYEELPPASPDQPKISVSLKGDLNPLQVADMAIKAGADPKSGDPILDPDLRKMMMSIYNTGQLPPDQESMGQHLDHTKKVIDIGKSLIPEQQNVGQTQ